MELWLDTCNPSIIEDAKDRGLLYGITTNPLILSKNDTPPLRVLAELLKMQNGPVTAQVTACLQKI